MYPEWRMRTVESDPNGPRISGKRLVKISTLLPPTGNSHEQFIKYCFSFLGRGYTWGEIVDLAAQVQKCPLSMAAGG